MPSTNRKLAAILFADIVGYTALMQKDDARASALLRHFQTQLEEKVSALNGRIVNFYGDGALCTFTIPIDALRCAMALQTLFAEVPQTPVRIGIHLGTVTMEGDKVFGDSVNIASRIESMGVASSILLSKKVRDEVKNNPDLQLQSLGSFEFKNVEEPMELFALANEGFVTPSRKDLKRKLSGRHRKRGIERNWVLAALVGVVALLGLLWWTGMVAPGTHQELKKPSAGYSIVVLPFENLSTAAENQYFADGMMEDILNNLAKVKELQVISRTTSMKYRNAQKSVPEIAKELNANLVLEGSVQRFENQLKIVVQLIDALNDRHLWSEKYEREMKDVFNVQSEVAYAITNKLKIDLLPQEKAQINYQPTANIEAYDLYLKGRNYLQAHKENQKLDDLQQADSLFSLALNLEPHFALAKVGLANSYIRSFFFAGKTEAWVDSALVLTQQALSLVPDLFEAHIQLGNIERFKGNADAAWEQYQYAVDLRPNSAEAIRLLANGYNFQKKAYEKAVPLYKRLLLIDPEDDESMAALALIYRELEYYELSESYYLKAIEVNPNSAFPHHLMATFYMRQAKFEDALQAVQKALAISDYRLWTIFYAGEVLSYLGRFEEAVPYFERILSRVNQEGYNESSNTAPYHHRYAYVLWNLGQKKRARVLLEQAIEKHTRVIETDKYVAWGGAPYDLASIYAFLGDKKKAYYWLDEVLAKDTWMDYRHASFDPMFESIRGEERFEHIVAQRRNQAMALRKRFEAAELEGLLD